MTAVGGSIESVGLRGREFAVGAEAAANRRIGGKQNEVRMNGNNKTARLVSTAMSWLVSGLALEIDDSRNDQEFLQELADSKDFFPIEITWASGSTSQGTGQIVEEITLDTQDATATVSLSGPGRLTLQ